MLDDVACHDEVDSVEIDLTSPDGRGIRHDCVVEDPGFGDGLDSFGIQFDPDALFGGLRERHVETCGRLRDERLHRASRLARDSEMKYLTALCEFSKKVPLES